ncbi:MAG: hypothetical protein AAGI46_05315 [Planctomycetota bacterium]
MLANQQPDLSRVPDVGHIPYRLALAGGWIDQPFVSRLNPKPPGSMVTVGVEPTVRFMSRAGIASGTRRVARELWGDRLPDRDPADLVRELYAAENEGQSEPSGSQDMIGLIYPGVCRLDFDASVEGGVFPSHIESCTDPEVLDWLERVIHVLVVEPRPPGYNPLGEQHLDPETIAALGQSGKDCFDAIVDRDIDKLGRSFNDCVECWGSLLPHVLRHPTLNVDLPAVLQAYQDAYAGAMFSGCGGGYLYVLSEEPVEGAFQVRLRRAS